jgi:hypothetical protein
MSGVKITPNGVYTELRSDGLLWFQEPLFGGWYNNTHPRYYYDAELDVVCHRAFSFWVNRTEMAISDARWNNKYGRYEPIGCVYNTRGWWEKPDHTWINGKFWHVDDPNKPTKALKLNEVGLSLRESTLGCGTKHLFGFTFDTTDTKAVALMFETELKYYRQNVTGIILSVLNPSQNPRYGPILLAAGFELLSTHTNYMHNHLNYLYGFKCMDHPAIVEEKERAFGK